MAKGAFDKKLLDLTCPECRKRTRKSVAWFKTHPTFTCAGCGADVATNQDEFARGMKKIEKALAGLNKAFKSIK